MQDYIGFAEKNNILLQDEGPCQFCNASTTLGVHECQEVFNLGFSQIDYQQAHNHWYRFLCVDAHTLQHPEIHGRWNNHFHLSRQHLIFRYNVAWTYAHSPMLSNVLKHYKTQHPDERLAPPDIGQRGSLTVIDVAQRATDTASCQALIKQWGLSVYRAWQMHHAVIDRIAQHFLKLPK